MSVESKDDCRQQGLGLACEWKYISSTPVGTGIEPVQVLALATSHSDVSPRTLSCGLFTFAFGCV
jgi:hypothetical protein